MEEHKNNITYFAETDFRNKRTPFGIKDLDRMRHIYVIGKTGMGKSTLLENMAAQDIKNGKGMCFIDPHGSAVDTLLDYVPENRIEDVVYFSPSDVNNPIAFNVMEDVGPDKRHLVAQGLLSSFKKIWGAESFSDRMEHITSNTLLALLEYPGSTMLSIPRIFVDKVFQKKVVANITDPIVKAFWEQEYASWDDRYRKEAYSAVLNKIGQFTSNPIIRNIVGQPKSSFDFRKVLDEGKILLINLSIGQIGELNADLLGSMLSTKVYLTAMSRADLSKEELAKRPPFFLYIDEFQNLANDSFADILSQARKYNLSLTLAHQYIEQMPETVSAAVFGNIGSMITFRIGPTDAEMLEKEFTPTFIADDLVNLGFAQIYLRLMIDGVASQPFSARTLPPVAFDGMSYRDEIIEASRKNFTRPKDEVEREIVEWIGPGKKEEKKTDFKSPPKTGTKPYTKTEAKPFTQTAPAKSSSSFQSKPTSQTPARPFVSNSPKTYTPRKPLHQDAPALEGNSSLKEALQSLTQKNREDSPSKINEIKEKGNKINNEINTANKNKLKEALGGILEEQKRAEKAILDKLNEDNNQKTTGNHPNMKREIPENVLKDLLSDEK